MTGKQKATIQALLDNPTISVSEAMRRGGYSASTALKPHLVKRLPSFQDLLSGIDDSVLLTRLDAIAQDEDKRSALQAIDMLLKLKDRFPAGKLKVQAYNEEIERLQEGNASIPPDSG